MVVSTVVSSTHQARSTTRIILWVTVPVSETTFVVVAVLRVVLHTDSCRLAEPARGRTIAVIIARFHTRHLDVVNGERLIRCSLVQRRCHFERKTTIAHISHNELNVVNLFHPPRARDPADISACISTTSATPHLLPVGRDDALFTLPRVDKHEV